MKSEANIKFRNNSYYTVTIDLPNTCPHCGTTMVPTIHGGFSTDNANDENHVIGVLVSCSSADCNKYFSLSYLHVWDNRNFNGNYKLIPDTYRPPIKIELPENIEQVSPEFVEIYSQASKAQSEKLDQIAGVGYRKSLEFLTKDYAILKNPTDKDEIEKMFLSKVIQQYLTDFPKIQKLASAATWIGNDETHYVRKHTSKDINDMVAFIKSASQFIAADYDADIADQFIHGN